MPIQPKRTPDFFIVGAAKSGTTSLFYYLSQHPNLFLPEADKEPGYFCDQWGTDDPDYYDSLFTAADAGQLIGEASTPYLTCPASPKLLSRANPKAKIFILLRNPVERAFSLYKQMVKSGHEPLTPFRRALDAEPERAARSLEEQKATPGYHHNYLYVGSGCYEIQLERVFDAFPKEQVRVILFDDFVRDTKGEVVAALEFLGVTPDLDFQSEVFNPSQFPRSARIQHLLKRQIEDRSRSRSFDLGIRIAHLLKRANLRFGRSPKLGRNEYNELVERLSGSIRATSAILGRDLSTWLEKR